MIEDPVILVGEDNKPATNAQPREKSILSLNIQSHECDTVLLQSVKGANALCFW
jgi:hypothetical protein